MKRLLAAIPLLLMSAGCHLPPHSHKIGAIPTPHLFWVLPFVLLLLAIAVLPLTAPEFWERNLNKGIVAGLLALPVLVYYLIVGPQEIPYHLEEYTGFIVLLFSLYTISGGIVLTGNLDATPGMNTLFLAIGAILANVFGTTGAAMLLIRPLLKTNMDRNYKTHTVIFFTFIVSNIGGCLTPLGDPPLYMGYLHGIPFTYTLTLWPEWLFMNGILLFIYYLWDRRAWAKEESYVKKAEEKFQEPVRVRGWVNILLITGVLVVIISGLEFPYRELIMLILAGVSLLATPKGLRKQNFFNFDAIIEVAVLFLGIFITMIPALILLEQKGASLGIEKPWHYFWATGLLSSFLDNTPTYLNFASLAEGAHHVHHLKDLLLTAEGQATIRAVSIGAVFMGANTYIGNGPNFMIKAIAEAKGPTKVDMPSFAGYMKYSAMILLPLFVMVTLIFFV